MPLLGASTGTHPPEPVLLTGCQPYYPTCLCALCRRVTPMVSILKQEALALLDSQKESFKASGGRLVAGGFCHHCSCS